LAGRDPLIIRAGAALPGSSSPSPAATLLAIERAEPPHFDPAVGTRAATRLAPAATIEVSAASRRSGVSSLFAQARDGSPTTPPQDIALPLSRVAWAAAWRARAVLTVGVALMVSNGSSAALASLRATAVTLRQLAGRAGCLDTTPSQGCAVIRSARQSLGPWAFSADQRSLYAIADDRSVVILRRNARTGALTPLRGRAGCLNASGAFGCLRARGVPWEEYFQGPDAVTVSPDGENVYVLAHRNDGSTILSFMRDRRTGALRQMPGRRGCITSRPVEGCGVMPGLGRSYRALETLAIDPDGNAVVAAGRVQISVYRRASRDGSLAAFSSTPTCFSFERRADCQPIAGAVGSGYQIHITFAPGGDSVSFTYGGYESNVDYETGKLVTLGRDRGTGALRPVPGLAGCLTRQGFSPPDVPLPPDTICTGVREIHTMLSPPAFVDHDTAIMATVAFTFPGANVFMLRRDRDTGGLFTPGSPGACWGDLPPTQSPPPCQATSELGWLLAGPVLASDRRTVFVASSRPGRSRGEVLSFPVGAGPSGLGVPRSAPWISRTKNTYWVRIQLHSRRVSTAGGFSF